MTDRFELYYSKSKREYYIRDTLGEIRCFGCVDNEVAEYICKEWNKLYNENKESIKNIDCSVLLGTNDLLDELNRLSDENELLKSQLDYIQSSISKAIKHQKTELGQKALKEIIADYNEWLIGHKKDGLND